MDKDATKDRLKGKYNEAVGESKERVGRAIGHDDLESSGHQQEMKGKLQGKKADLQDAAEDVKDAAKKVV